MHIYIDESGSFAVPKNGTDGFCCVGALVIPDRNHGRLIKDYVKLTESWLPNEQEVKGSFLNEIQAMEVINLLHRNHAKLFVAATSGALHTVDGLRDYRDEQARRLTAHITPSHHPNLQRQMRELQVKMHGMAPQEYLQFELLSSVIERVLRVTPNHFAFCVPDELGAFRWRADAKNDGRSALEVCWKLLGGGFLQSVFLRDPFMMIPGGDVSYFDEAFLSKSQDWPRHLPNPVRKGSSGGILHLGKVLKDFKFSDSKSECGLQLVDIATNAFRRAARGNFSHDLCVPLGEILITFEKQAIGLTYLTMEAPRTAPELPPKIQAALTVMESRALVIGTSRWCDRYTRKFLRNHR